MAYFVRIWIAIGRGIFEISSSVILRSMEGICVVPSGGGSGAGPMGGVWVVPAGCVEFLVLCCSKICRSRNVYCRKLSMV